MVGKTVSHYRVVEILGAGGMGVVYNSHRTIATPSGRSSGSSI